MDRPEPTLKTKNRPLDLVDSLYRLGELEFFHPEENFDSDREQIEKSVECAASLPEQELREFARVTVDEISKFCLDPARNADVLYRAFDSLDQILEIDYSQDESTLVKGVDEHERLYINGGIGVQTSYSSVFAVLARLQLPRNAHLVDLGSGFGRIGLAAGLHKSDIRFTGYEYVSQRVMIAEKSAQRAGINDRVKFFAQDLSDRDFVIPEADVYYLYDPFSQDTYKYVLNRIEEVARTRPVSVVAKGWARDATLKMFNLANWSEPEHLNDHAIFILRSLNKQGRNRE